MIIFGVGKLTATPKGTSTPIEFGVLQDVGVDISFGKKELYGEKQFPVDVARTQGKINIKAKAAKIDATLFNEIFFGSTMQTTGNTSTITVTNQPMGAAPEFGLKLETVYKGQKLTMNFVRCQSSKLGLSLKNEDFMIPDFDIDAMADDAGQLYTMALSEAS